MESTLPSSLGQYRLHYLISFPSLEIQVAGALQCIKVQQGNSQEPNPTWMVCGYGDTTQHRLSEGQQSAKHGSSSKEELKDVRFLSHFIPQS